MQSTTREKRFEHDVNNRKKYLKNTKTHVLAVLGLFWAAPQTTREARSQEEHDTASCSAAYSPTRWKGAAPKPVRKTPHRAAQRDDFQQPRLEAQNANSER
jgi:hypothetical protein